MGRLTATAAIPGVVPCFARYSLQPSSRAALAASPVLAQTGAAVVGKAPGKVAMAQTVKATATITAIDAATRAITLKGPKGNETVVTAGPE